MMMFLRQENEDIFTAVTSTPATLKGFVLALSVKYQVRTSVFSRCEHYGSNNHFVLLLDHYSC
jgi:hypothetical protein